jgi:hypothetical protein
MEFPDAPLCGLYARNRVYEGVVEIESFVPGLERLEMPISERVLAELSEEIPPAWYEDDYGGKAGKSRKRASSQCVVGWAAEWQMGSTPSYRLLTSPERKRSDGQRHIRNQG